MRFPILILLVLQFFTANKAIGQSNPFSDCLINKEDVNSCLTIGTLNINSDRNSFDKAFGKPDDVQLSGDTTIVMYKLPRASRVRNPKYKYLKRPYVLITELGERTHSIQLNGYNTKLSLDFYGISLGSTAEKVTKLFGAPKEVWYWKLLKADIWYFESEAYAFMVQDSKVVSIKLFKK